MLKIIWWPSLRIYGPPSNRKHNCLTPVVVTMDRKDFWCRILFILIWSFHFESLVSKTAFEIQIPVGTTNEDSFKFVSTYSECLLSLMDLMLNLKLNYTKYQRLFLPPLWAVVILGVLFNFSALILSMLPIFTPRLSKNRIRVFSLSSPRPVNDIKITPSVALTGSNLISSLTTLAKSLAFS